MAQWRNGAVEFAYERDLFGMRNPVIHKATLRAAAEMGIDLFEMNEEDASHFLSIYKSLHSMFSERENREKWLRTFHPELGDVPLAMMGNSEMITVRRYLDFVKDRA
jgi:hypothetical protein